MRQGWGPKPRAGALAGVFAGAGRVHAGRGIAGVLADGRRAILGWAAACAREEADQRRLFLWLPVFFGAGVLLYFAAEAEPALWAPLAGASLSFAAALRFRQNEAQTAFRAFLALSFLFAGFSAGSLKTQRSNAPVIQRMTIAATTAYVEAIDFRTNGARLLLRPHSIAGLEAAGLPERVRVTMRWRPDFSAGATIEATLRLLPPPVQSEPGGYNFARDAYFAGIGGVGNLVSRPQAVAGQAVELDARINAWIDRARNRLTERIASVIGGADGAVAAALVTGKRGTIPESANEQLRAAGIYHIVSISGLHMVLAAGLFLWAMRAAFALFPDLALSRPIKVWSAVFAMAGAVAYCLFSGAEVATQRALIMTLVMLGAIVAGRAVLSMRNLAIAALIVMALDPNALLGPSFQMSFAAVAAMIAAFERRAGTRDDGAFWGVRKERPDPALDMRASPINRVMLVLFAMALTTLVASFATDPYALYHFHRITPYGLLGNMLVLPLVEFIVMPAAVIGVVASPFGLDAPVWWLMGQGVAFMMDVAKWVASLKGSTLMLPAFGYGALLLMTLGLLWLTLWQSAIRWAGIALAAAGVALAATGNAPDLVVTGQGRLVA
ncbi:MAG: ComEC/Rec2 family competence protein, partial [Beijerinckiaceae bacterium]